MRKTLIAVLALAASVCHAQRASIKKVELAGEKIIVHYDLEDSNPANEYQIYLYASQNNFATAVTKVKGDVGNEIRAGSGKRIEWNIVQELGPYKGKLSLEIRGKMFVPVAKLNNLSEGDKLKRGKTHLLTWKPGSSNPVNIELLKDGETVNSQPNQPNNGSYGLSIPTQTAPGKNYSLRISDTRDPENTVTSQTFTITRKVPLLFKVIPFIAIGGAAAVLMGGDSGGPEDPGGNNSGVIELPGFPD